MEASSMALPVKIHILFRLSGSRLPFKRLFSGFSMDIFISFGIFLLEISWKQRVDTGCKQNTYSVFRIYRKTCNLVLYASSARYYGYADVFYYLLKARYYALDPALQILHRSGVLQQKCLSLQKN